MKKDEKRDKKTNLEKPPEKPEGKRGYGHPEPATIALLGLGGLCLLKRR